ncbi:MAG: TolC family protein [Algoriphagus sp.]|uniref:TolC family protein n=1 Tax=Algoriphagus sp. TaxID=1872435 RepID=UPI002733CCF1|nr:TolC family protein [Algoriphagus sp.]MDP3472842.1 TolC family protein [Algoriphagus sp.]
MKKLKDFGFRISDFGVWLLIMPQLMSSITLLKGWFAKTCLRYRQAQTTAREKSVSIRENLWEKLKNSTFSLQLSDLKFQISNFKFQIFYLALPLCLSLFTYQAKAQSLDDYLIQAAQNNPGLKASYSRYMASMERSGQVALPDPELRVGFFIRPMERFMGNQQADIQLMQMFPWFGMLSAQKEEANYMALAQYQLFLEEKNQLFFQVKSTWYELHRLNEEIRISEENLEYLKKYERLALIKYQAAAPTTGGAAPTPSNQTASTSGSSSAGASSMNSMGATTSQMPTSASSMSSGMGSSGTGSGMSDVLQIRIEMKELESNLSQLEANMEPLQIKFNQLLNRENREEILLSAALSPANLDNGKLEVLENIKASNPMLAMYDSEMAAYDQQARMAKLDGRPMLGAGVNYMPFKPRLEDGMMMGGDNMVMPMVTMTLPIYRKKTNAKIKEAEYLKEATSLTRQKTENLLTMEWANAFRDWEDAERKIRLYTEQVKLVDQTINLLLTAYSNSGRDFTEVLRAQQLLLDYQLKRVNAINQQYQSLAMLEMLASSDAQLQ